MSLSRRDLLRFAPLATAGLAFSLGRGPTLLAQSPGTAPSSRKAQDLTIKEVRVTPIALPDPPLLAASGCHGPYYLRAIVEIVTTDGIRCR